MPISLRLLMVWLPDLAVAWKACGTPRPPAKGRGSEGETLRRVLSSRLSPRLVRDVLPD